MSSRALPRTGGRPPRSRRIAVLLAALLVAGCLASCAAIAPPPTARTSAVEDGSAPLREDALYVAVAVRHAGQPEGWLPRSPIRLWFEPLNGVRTAIIDAPVNTFDVPTIDDGDALWTGRNTAVTDAGCARGGDADGFVGRIAERPARQHWAGGSLTVTAGEDVAVFAPTRAPVPERSGCDLSSIDPFPCGRLLSVSGSIDGAVIDALRTDPLTVSVTGSGAHRIVSVRADRLTILAPLRITDGSGTTRAGSATVAGSCPTGTAGCASGAFAEAMLAAAVDWDVHGTSILLTSGGRTLQLEAR